jgi:protein-tyrosine-phosphatase
MDTIRKDPSQSAGEPPRPVRVLFLCTHNNARSQLAEGILRSLGGEGVLAFSAGSEPSAIHPNAVRVLTAMGIDSSAQRSKHMSELSGQPFDYVVTVCDRVREVCPTFPGNPRQLHWSLHDPAAVVGSDAAELQAFERTARQLEVRIKNLLATIESERKTER